MQDDPVGDGLGGWCVGWASVVAVGGAAFACSGRCAAWSFRYEVGGFAELGGEVVYLAGEVSRGERTARVVLLRAASRARLKLIREGSRPVTAWPIRSRTAW